MGTFPEPMFWKLADNFGSDVFLLGSNLGIPYREMQSISLTDQRNPKKWGFEALVQWQNNLEEGISKKEALDKMKNAFHEAERKDLVDVADQLFEQYGKHNNEQQLQGDGLKSAARRAKGNIDMIVQAHEVHKEKLKEAEEKVRKMENENQMLKKEKENGIIQLKKKIADVQMEKNQKLSEAQKKIKVMDEKMKHLEIENHNLVAAKASDKNNNIDSSTEKPSIPEDKLPIGVVQQYKAYNCACNLPSCLRCQVLPQAEELVGGGRLCQEKQTEWQQRISAIKCGSRSAQEWRSLYACPHCHTFECLSQYRTTLASILQLCQGHTDASPDVTTRREVVAMMEKVQSSVCKDKKAWWQYNINKLQQHQGTLQQWWNSAWRCADCESVQCANQNIPVHAKMCTTIEAMSQ